MKTLVIWMIFSIVPLHQASEQTVYTFGQNCSVVITVNPEDEIYVLYEGGSLSNACDTFQFKHNSTLCITSLNHDDPDCAVELQYYIKNDSRTTEKRYTCTSRPDENDYCVKEKETMFLKLHSLSYNRQNVIIKLRIKLLEVEAPANKYMPSNGAYPTQTSGQQTTNLSNEPAGYPPSSKTGNYSTPQDFSAFTYSNPVS
ncbi:uncharacterized protein [Mytilus edulis]|uniref:uncharacterized protein isoform X3 n=1 Tax=Mytilus edulis TaxID=6550 RepID=UPI0039F11BBF